MLLSRRKACSLKRPSALKAWGLRLAKKRGLKRACVALARKLAGVLHRMWLDGSEFRYAAQEAPAS